MVTYCGSEHRYLECSNEKLAEYLYKAVDARCLPCMADVESSMLYFCSQVSQYSKAALTGECADEIFGGYPWFHKKKPLRQTDFRGQQISLSGRVCFRKSGFGSFR